MMARDRNNMSELLTFSGAMSPSKALDDRDSPDNVSAVDSGSVILNRSRVCGGFSKTRTDSLRYFRDKFFLTGQFRHLSTPP